MKHFDENNQPISAIEKTGEMLDEKKFWSIVDKSLVDSKDQVGQLEYLMKEVEKLTPKEIIGFRLRTDKLLFDSFNSELWCAGTLMNGYCSDDGYEHFRCWIISRGKETFQKALQNPDYLIYEVIDGEKIYEFELFWYVALDAFEKKTGHILTNYIDTQKFTTNEWNYPTLNFTWSKDYPATMEKICPKLFERFYKRVI
jgi:hypothetical protein